MAPMHQVACFVPDALVWADENALAGALTDGAG